MEDQTAIWAHCLAHAAHSDIGLRRGNNQDALAVAIATGQEDWQQRGHLFMVADGMGAHAAGELASKMATDTVPLSYHKLADRSPPEALLGAILEANSQIHSRGQASQDFKGMGTTCTVLVLLPQGALVAHVGDSRVYRVRGQRIEQLTFDHSLVWEMRRAGQISSEAVPGFFGKNIITRSLGPNPVVQVDLEGPLPFDVGDTFLLCSDGLSGQVKDDEIGAVLSCLPPAEAARALIDLANLRGGPDNITAVVVRVTGPQVAKTAGPQPAPATGAKRPNPIHPLVWTLLGVFVLAAAGLAIMDFLVAALIGLVAAAVVAIVAIAQRYSEPEPGYFFGGRRLGGGPYAACDCAPNAEIVERLKDIVEQLRQATAAKRWGVDWSGFDAPAHRAAAAAAQGDHAQATPEYLHAISFMMEQLKRQPRVAES